MTLVHNSQIEQLLYAYVRVNGFTASGTSTNVTTAITTALSTAGKGGVAVPLQVASASVVGVITTGSDNRVEIYDATTKQKISDDSNEIYGRITESSGVYTLSYYALVTGVETAVTVAQDIDFEFIYNFDFGRLPQNALVAVKARNVSDDPSSGSGSPFDEVLTVTALNTVSDLTKTPTGSVKLFANGQMTSSLTNAFTVVGKVITWNATNAKYALLTTFEVIASYNTLE